MFLPSWAPDSPGPNLPRTLSSSFHTLTEPNWNLLQITIDSQRFVETLRNPWDLQIMIVMIGMDNVYNIVIYSQTWKDINLALEKSRRPISASFSRRSNKIRLEWSWMWMIISLIKMQQDKLPNLVKGFLLSLKKLVKMYQLLFLIRDWNNNYNMTFVALSCIDDFLAIESGQCSSVTKRFQAGKCKWRMVTIILKYNDFCFIH